jgi:hypothetical protein
MEVNNHDIGESRVPVQVTPPEAATLDIIRTETVLSRLPVHNLAKKGSISIQILKKTATGEVELLWRISPSRDYGEPRQLAYKLDTIIINQRIDEAGRPLPKLLRLGSLNDICAELGLTLDHGTNAKNIRNAFLQNALTGITAKFNYKANDGTERRLEAGFTRYSVIFTGEKLPDGRKADAVYIIFNEPFWEVLNNAPVRPLDRTYMKELPPAAQRFYEIVSRKIFAALKNNYPYAKISYSEYCTFSAQLRHTERQPVQDQMAKIIRHHKKSGYITAVKYEATIDEQNQADWIMYLTPGPKAYAEFAVAHGGRKLRKLSEPNTFEAGEHQPKRARSGSKYERSNMEPAAPQPTFDPQLIAEFTRRGISEKKAAQLLVNLKPGQDVVAQLEHTDLLVRGARTPIVNPPGFYIRLIESNTSVPDSFETSAKRKARGERELEERRLDDKRRAQEDLENEYEWYRTEEIERYIAALDPAEVATVLEAKHKENEAKHQTPWMIKEFAELDMKREFATRVSLMTIEEFKAKRDRQSDSFFLKQVPDPAPAEAAALEPVAVTPVSEEAPIYQAVPATAVDAPAASVVEGGGAILLSPKVSLPPATLEPVIELAAEYPEAESSTTPVEPGLA